MTDHRPPRQEGTRDHRRRPNIVSGASTDRESQRPEGTRDHRGRPSGVSGVFVEPSLTTFVAGTGVVEQDEHGGVLTLPQASSKVYSDAQLQDYGGLARRDYPWRPPLHFSIEARFSRHLHGTAGFGLWNNPVSLRGVPALPRALWFFWASPPSRMELAQGVPGHGWKAATIDAGRGQALAWAPFAPVVLLLCRHGCVRRRLWPWVQRALAIEERCLDERAQRAPATNDERPTTSGDDSIVCRSH